MDPLLILAVGICIVLGGILWGRWPAFLALIVAAWAVAALVPLQQRYVSALGDRAAQIAQIIPAADGTARLRLDRPVRAGGYQILSPDRTRSVGTIELAVATPARDAGAPQAQKPLRDDGPGENGPPHDWQAIWIDAEAAWPPPGATLVSSDEWPAVQRAARRSAPERVAAGFGATCQSIGILIVLASITGRCLLDSGAAERIVTCARHICGDRHAAIGLAVSGFVIGIPVFFDTVFYLMLPLARALTRATRKDYLLYVLAIIVGATMAHSLVPPTPGPLLVANALGVDLGLMMQAGIGVGLVTVCSGFLYAVWANRRWPLVPADDAPLEPVNLAEHGEPMSGAHGTVAATQPSLVISLLPILLPVALLSGAALLPPPPTSLEPDTGTVWTVVAGWLRLVSDKHVAVGIAAGIGMTLLRRHGGTTAHGRAQAIQDAISGAGSIVLITAAGGAFGETLRESGIAEALQVRFPAAQAGQGLLLLAFAVTALVRAAQGSATVAMITAVGIVGPLVRSATLPYHPVYVALAIGCGSKPFPWMNDSGFWVVTRMSGMTESLALRTFSAALTVMGFVGLLTTLAAASLWPLLPPAG